MFMGLIGAAYLGFCLCPHLYVMVTVGILWG